MVRPLFIALLLGQSSCVGISIIAGTKQEYVGSTLGAKVGEAGDRNGGVTTEDALRLWGKPKRKGQVGTHEVWVYKARQQSWRGAEVWGIVPVPLLLPVGRKKVTLDFQDKQLMRYAIDACRGRFVGFFISQTGSDLWWFFREDLSYDGYWGNY